jgi:predicted RNA-binding protein associated with RNAse of E/G family
MNTEELRKQIFDTIDKMIDCFLYYDRKEDVGLEVGEIEDAVKAGQITVNEMIKRISENLIKGIHGK